MLKKILLFLALTGNFLPVQSADSLPQDKVLDLSGGELGGDFSLHSSQGAFSLQQLRGKLVLLYFGYTKCPDVCPTSLALLSQALNELNKQELNQVQGLFVSVDPKRDSFQVLDEYVSYFHPSLIGLTGSEAEVAKAAKLYGAQYREVKLSDSAFDYAVDHSATTYLITQSGELRFVFPHETPASVILEAIRYLISEAQH
jgi:protein SCO1/2